MDRQIKRVCVFCGSRAGRRDAFTVAARTIGHLLATRGVGVVYGGGGSGLMGCLADSAMRAGGEVIGVIPSFLVGQERAHPDVRDMRVVETLSQRKEMMMTLADGFIVLPGGVGTLDELFEVVSLRFLGLHDKPIGLLDVHGYFTQIREMSEMGQEEQFIHESVLDVMIHETDPERLLERVIDGVPAMR